MKRQLQGIVLVLFGMLLVLIAVVSKNWVPMIDSDFEGFFAFILLWLGLIIGIIGLILSFSKDNNGK